ncbi:MAG TPA: uracil-DNA glycosylase [Kiritimatiellia bacterium]|nr:uracil-DNA glycosylase [Kiritimatiellia bacterium]
MHDSWMPFMEAESRQPYFAALMRFVDDAYASCTVYPPKEDICNAYALDPDAVKVVILGQDPYHGPGQAHGLAFSVNDGVPLPPSLRNIFLEVQRDTGAPMPATGHLRRWADQGVMLLNTTLTVEAGRAGSHRGRGWERFTDATIRWLAARRDSLVFMLWGNDARRKKALIDVSRHLVLEAAHPSPLSAHAGFFGCGHFSQANDCLLAHGHKPIIW